MDNDSLPELIKEHYNRSQLSENRVSEILDACAVARSAYRWRKWAIVSSSVAAAAVFALLISLSGILTSAPQQTVVEQPPAPLSVQDQQLVAAMIHAQDCPNSAAIQPVFAKLQQEFVNEPVLFVTLDVSSDCARRQAELLSACLGVQDAFEQHPRTGNILLVSTASGKICDVVDREQPIAVAAASVRHGLTLSDL
jgi:thiol-disulfide isomerase/thioredoxin